MNIIRIEQYDLCVPFLRPFQTSYGQTTTKEASIYVLHDESGAIGLGELDALVHPDYIEEYLATARETVAQYFIPRLLHHDWQHPSDIEQLFADVQGNWMAKSALETAAWDCYARSQQQPLYSLLGGVKRPIPVGISLGIQADSIHLLKRVEEAVSNGYTRIKVKIKPGYDYQPLKAIRTAYPTLTLMADANSAYQGTNDWQVFEQLDTLQLAMIEQPFGVRDFVGHAQLQQALKTPICLDESIRSVEDVQTAAALNSCQAINLKIPRVGGLTAALAILKAANDADMLVWLGGMYELGVGRACNLHFSARSELTFPGDLSASNRYFQSDVVTPTAKLSHGTLTIPGKAGIGVSFEPKEWQTNYRVFS